MNNEFTYIWYCKIIIMYAMTRYLFMHNIFKSLRYACHRGHNCTHRKPLTDLLSQESSTFTQYNTY